MTSLAETRQLLGAWLTAVADVVRGVNAAEPLEVLLSRIAEQACRLVGFDFCAVMLVDPAGGWLQTRGSHGLSPEYVALLNREHVVVVRPADTVAAHAFRGAATLAVPDILREGEYPSTRRLAVDQGFRALLAVPLPASTAPRCVLVAYSTVPREFGPPSPPPTRPPPRPTRPRAGGGRSGPRWSRCGRATRWCRSGAAAPTGDPRGWRRW